MLLTHTQNDTLQVAGLGARDGRVCLVRVQPAVRQLLELWKVQKLFEINA
jgi:anti-anti-sigma regulatory factor